MCLNDALYLCSPVFHLGQNSKAAHLAGRKGDQWQLIIGDYLCDRVSPLRSMKVDTIFGCSV